LGSLLWQWYRLDAARCVAGVGGALAGPVPGQYAVSTVGYAEDAEGRRPMHIVSAGTATGRTWIRCEPVPVVASHG